MDNLKPLSEFEIFITFVDDTKKGNFAEVDLLAERTTPETIVPIDEEFYYTYVGED